jgi:glycosyltransferase involved in cell wall biosynthesis
MHIGLVCPFTHGPTRGNITSVQRIAKYLRLLGCTVSLIPLDCPEPQRLGAGNPDLLHGFHAYHAGPETRRQSLSLQVPYLLTLTGSDLFDPTFRDHPATLQAIDDAAVVTCFDPLVSQLAAESFPQASHKLLVLPQGVEPFPTAVPRAKSDDTFVILLPAALRPVKGVEWAIDQLAPLAAEQHHMQLWIAGGVLDAGYADQIRSKAADLPWIHLLGEVPYQDMGSLYASADLVLNSSLFEGGMANALLEAMVMAKPVLARDIPGNHSLIYHGKTGWLFGNGKELRQLVLEKAVQPDQRASIGQAAQTYVINHFSPEREASSLVQIYSRLLT